MSTELTNQAFIDAQNLYLGTVNTSPAWKIDFVRFRVFLKDRYNVSKAYYFIGVKEEKHQKLYDYLEKAGYILIFRDHATTQVSKKKGNVDNDIIFTIMKKLCEREKFGKVILVSGDGDYKRMVDYLVEKDRLLKIMFPNGVKASSLYKKLGQSLTLNLARPELRKKLGQ